MYLVRSETGMLYRAHFALQSAQSEKVVIALPSAKSSRRSRRKELPFLQPEMHPLRRIRLSAGSALQLPLLPLPSPGKGVTTEAVCGEKEHHWLTQWWSEVFGGDCSGARSNHLRAKDCASVAKWLGLRLYRKCFLQSNPLTCTEADWGLTLELLQVLHMFLRWLCDYDIYLHLAMCIWWHHEATVSEKSNRAGNRLRYKIFLSYICM